MTINIAGWSKLSTVDWPGHLSAVLFLQGCPWRCNYCHNYEILDPNVKGSVDYDEFIDFARKRRGLLDAVVFSGGEALLQGEDLIAAMREVKEMGFKVGLHTGGAYPATLRWIIEAELVDWIGFDLKAPLDKYRGVTNNVMAAQNAVESVKIVVAALEDLDADGQSKISEGVQWRTTVDETVFTDGDKERLQADFAALGVPADEIVWQEVRAIGAPDDYADALLALRSN